MTEKPKPKKPEPWQCLDDDEGRWMCPDCGGNFVFQWFGEDPVSNRWKYCPRCGKRRYEDEVQGDRQEK